MATIEKDTLLSVKDIEGNLVLLYPTTKSDLVMYNDLTVEEAIATLESSSEGYAYKSNIEKGKLFAKNWSGNTYAFPEYPADHYDIEVFVSADSTQEEFEAYSGAQMVGDVADNKLKAYGDVPTNDIPIVIKATQKTNELFGTDIFIILKATDGNDAIPLNSSIGMDIYRGSTLIEQLKQYSGTDSYAFSINYEDETQLTTILQQQCKFIFTESIYGASINAPVESFTVLDEDGLVKVVISVDASLLTEITKNIGVGGGGSAQD